MLRIKAKVPSYWKATNLDAFDGVRWLEGPPSRDSIAEPRLNRRWLQTISVVDRGLRSTQFVGAGVVQDILPGSSRLALPQSDGTFVTSSKPLRPGDSYQALVYVPRPSERQLERSGNNYPGFAQDFLELRVPLTPGSPEIVDQRTGRSLGHNVPLRFAAYGTPGGALVVWPTGFGVQQDGEQVMASSPYAQLYALTQEIKRSTHSPYEFVQAVQERVQAGTKYDENPPQRRYPLAAFLFDTKTGYCQQFSGVMALMLRMGGIPARVASGFSPGTYNSERKDYVLRDTDAHSWVEAYFAPYGWITFDPTPPASPAASQLDDNAVSPNGGPTLPPNFGSRLGQSGDRPFAPGDPGADIAPADAGGGWRLPVGAAVVALLALLSGVLLWRRRTPFVTHAPELAELERALHRSGRDPAPNVTLARLEALLGGSEPAAAYVRAVRDRRYARATAPPTRAQRRALRRQLASGLGLRGVLRAWWALPPLPLGPLKDRLRRPYTQK
jgi:transglutaminase-like putative cysteine protease